MACSIVESKMSFSDDIKAGPVISAFLKISSKIVESIFNRFFDVIIPETVDRGIVFTVARERIDMSPFELEPHESETVRKAAALAKQFFLKAPPISFNEDDFSNSEVMRNPMLVPEAWAERCCFLAYSFCTDHVVHRVIDLPEELQNLSCYHYALHQVGFLCESFESEELPSILEFQLGATRVEFSPQEGDLVLYLKKGVPTHMGVYRRDGDDGLVESKWGNLRTKAYLHRIEDVPESYGKENWYYRPPALKN